MKKLTVVLLAALCVIALAPRDLAAGVGIKGGYSLAKFSLTPADYRSGVEVSAVLGGRRLLRVSSWASCPCNPRSSIPAWAPRSRTKSRISGSSTGIDYVQVPVLLKFNIVPAGPIRPFLYGGGYGAYLVKAEGFMQMGEESEYGGHHRRLQQIRLRRRRRRRSGVQAARRLPLRRGPLQLRPGEHPQGPDRGRGDEEPVDHGPGRRRLLTPGLRISLTSCFAPPRPGWGVFFAHLPIPGNPSLRLRTGIASSSPGRRAGCFQSLNRVMRVSR